MSRSPKNAKFLQLLKHMEVDDCLCFHFEEKDKSSLVRCAQQRKYSESKFFRTVVHENKLYVIRVD